MSSTNYKSQQELATYNSVNKKDINQVYTQLYLQVIITYIFGYTVYSHLQAEYNTVYLAPRSQFVRVRNGRQLTSPPKITWRAVTIIIIIIIITHT